MNKKIAGIILLSFGILFITFFAVQFLNKEQPLVSPIPDQDGIKVIYVTPQR